MRVKTLKVFFTFLVTCYNPMEKSGVFSQKKKKRRNLATRKPKTTHIFSHFEKKFKKWLNLTKKKTWGTPKS